MRRLLIVLSFVSLATSLCAQYYYVPYLNNPGNPGNYNTQAEIPANTLPSSWTLIQDSSTTPVWSPVQSLPIAFYFNGQPVTQYKVSTSGILTFNVGVIAVPDTIPENLPSSLIPDMSVCIWGMNGSGANDAIVTRTFGLSPNREHWVFFPSFSLGSGYTYWSIMLEESTNDIYIVDQRHSSDINSGLTLGVQVNDSVAAMVYGSPNVQPVSSGWAPSSDDNYYHFINGVQPVYDLIMKTNDMLPYQWIGDAPLIVKGTLDNYGSATVNSFDINYTVNGGAASGQTITGVNIAPYESYSFTHPTGWTPVAAGAHSIGLYANNINSNPDQNPDNDTIIALIEVLDTFIQRVVLHEVFTSSTCNPCKLGNEILDSVLHINPGKWTCIKYQMDYPSVGDPYFTDEGEARRSFYAVGGIPNLMVDGDYGNNPKGYVQNDLDLFCNVPSFLDISANFSLNGQAVAIDADIMPLIDFGSSIKAFIAIVEYRTYNNVKTNAETQFEYVMKKMIPDSTGISIGQLNAGQGVQINESYTFQGSYVLPLDASSPVNHAIEHTVENFDNLLAVVFLQDTITQEVLQSKFVGNSCFWLHPMASFSVDTSGLTASFTNNSTVVEDATYSWDFGDSAGVSIAENPVYTYANPGSYTTCLIVQDSCNADTICQVITVSSVPVVIESHLTDNDFLMLQLHPNPCGKEIGFVFRLTDRRHHVAWEVFDLLGCLVMDGEIADYNKGLNEKLVSVNGLPDGVYVFKLNIGDQSIQEKFIKLSQ